jgi:glycosyltransferase involved in cell wall biosynthesis
MIERVAQLKMSAHFHFTGFLKKDDIDKLWSLSNVYVMPSVSEPFGITPLEAIQNGVPVIVSRQSGVAEVMPHAIKIDFWNTHSLAGAICSVLRYGSLATALTQNGREEVKQMTWGKAARKINKLYHEVTTTN